MNVAVCFRYKGRTHRRWHGHPPLTLCRIETRKSETIEDAIIRRLSHREAREELRILFYETGVSAGPPPSYFPTTTHTNV